MAFAILVTVIIFLYIIIGTAACISYENRKSLTCPKRGRNDRCASWHKEYNWHNHTCTALWLAGIVWPIGIPVAIGVAIGNFSPSNHTANKQQKEIDAAQHKIRLAKLEAERVSLLERELGIGEPV